MTWKNIFEFVKTKNRAPSAPYIKYLIEYEMRL